MQIIFLSFTITVHLLSENVISPGVLEILFEICFSYLKIREEEKRNEKLRKQSSETVKAPQNRVYYHMWP